MISVALYVINTKRQSKTFLEMWNYERNSNHKVYNINCSVMMLTIFIQVVSKNFLGTFPPCRRLYRTKELSRFQIHYYWKGKYDIPFQKLTKLDFHWSKYLERFDSDSCQQQCQMHCCQCHVQCIWWPRTRFPRADFVEQSKK